MGISIHPMLRFNILNKKIKYIFSGFQYILCYGSTLHVLLAHQKKFGFQYILCYGSTLANLNKAMPPKYYFNTSYVTVQQFQRITKIPPKKYFNTSYVTVQPLVLCDLYFSSYLNSIEIATFGIDFSNKDQVFYQRKKCSKTIEIPTCT